VTRARTLAIMVVLVGCRGDEAKPKSSPSSAPTAEGSGSSVTATPEMRAFCIRSMQQLKTCFEDDKFWDAHATTFFAAQKQPVDAETKQRWIGNYKDSFATLIRDKQLEINCDTMLAQNQLPTPKQIELVDQAAKQSCAAFGGALGYVLFSEGAFYRSREGAVPASLELAPDKQ
jgi:hypothetical protein